MEGDQFFWLERLLLKYIFLGSYRSFTILFLWVILCIVT